MIETPQFPHGWDAGVFYERHHKILFSSDIGAQPGDGDIVTDRDVSSEALRFQSELGFLSEGADFKRSLDRVCQLELHLLATQHGSVLTSSAARCFLSALKHHISEPQGARAARKPTQCDE
jgi:flavorubredoxin